ncbi:MAG: enoyl-CoA hydratase/isomerase family protein [Alphaproteobacteria bacterium]
MSEATETLYDLRGRAAWITLNRPDSRNALSTTLVNQLFDHLATANGDPSVRCIVITGHGPAFCAGADLKNPPGQSATGDRAVPFETVLKAILDSPKPVLAAVNGAAFAGGLGLIGAADIAITVEDAPFSFSEVRIGVIPAIISVVCLPKLRPHHAAKLFLTGERFTGREAVAMGLAHGAVPADALHSAIERQVNMIALGGPQALAECKKLIRRLPDLSVDEAFAETAEWSARVFRSEEAAEGIAAFRERRKPSWVFDP